MGHFATVESGAPATPAPTPQTLNRSQHQPLNYTPETLHLTILSKNSTLNHKPPVGHGTLRDGGEWRPARRDPPQGLDRAGVWGWSGVGCRV